MFSFRKQSIFLKIFLLFVLVFSLSITSHVLVTKKVEREFLRKQARSISRLIVLTRQWVASMGGVWSKDVFSKDHGYLTTYIENPDAKSSAVFYLHNPALATREISTLANLGHGYDFRVVSDRAREPSNEPDAFETEAIQKLGYQEESFVDEYSGDVYRYVESLRVKKGCLRCHGDLRTDVKEPMRTILLKKYGQKAFGYRLGEIRGAISIRIVKEKTGSQLSSIFSYWNYAIAIATVLLFYLFSKFVVVKPIQRLTQAANQISMGKLDSDLGVDDLHSESRNEITQLAAAFDKMRTSYKIVADRLMKK